MKSNRRQSTKESQQLPDRSNQVKKNIKTPSFFAAEPIVRVVIIEDDEDDRDLLVRQLSKSQIDHHVKFLSDGKEALTFLLNLSPAPPFCDLIAIFLDLKLPGMSGVELLRRIRKMPLVQNTPVIVTTASIDPRDFEACQNLKVSAFIPKPITFELFSKAIIGLPQMAALGGKVAIPYAE